MIRRLAILLAVLAAAPATAFETLAVLAAGEPPGGPDADLAELAHQLRAACRDRIGGVQDVPTMRARLLGQRSNATVTELDRAYGGALAVYQNGEFESAIRTLKAIVEDLESLPETDESYAQWVRAQLRLAHAALTIGREREADDAMFAVARTDPAVQPDAEQYSPTYRRRFDAVKAKVRALPARRLQVTAEGFGGVVYVNGRQVGAAPLSLWLPAGSYRIGGASGSLHVPSFRVDLEVEDRAVILDFALAEALRVSGGPGLALPGPRRSVGIVRAGAWLGVDRVVAVSRVAEGDALFLLGSIFDVRNGSLLREGSVRTVAGTVPAANLGALASFLLTGQSSRDVKDRTELARAVPIPAPVEPQPPARAATPAPAAAPAARRRQARRRDRRSGEGGRDLREGARGRGEGPRLRAAPAPACPRGRAQLRAARADDARPRVPSPGRPCRARRLDAPRRVRVGPPRRRLHRARDPAGPLGAPVVGGRGGDGRAGGRPRRRIGCGPVQQPARPLPRRVPERLRLGRRRARLRRDRRRARLEVAGSRRRPRARRALLRRRPDPSSGARADAAVRYVCGGRRRWTATRRPSPCAGPTAT